jgi:hypothetical protein
VRVGKAIIFYDLDLWLQNISKIVEVEVYEHVMPLCHRRLFGSFFIYCYGRFITEKAECIKL